MSRIVRLAFWAIILLLTSCGSRQGRVRIRGQYENLPQADLLLYSPDGGLETIDTLHIVRGKFDYETRVGDDEPHTYVVVYPNYSTLAFQAHSGSDVRILGDAFSLGQEQVEGADSVLPREQSKGRTPLVIGKRIPKTKLIKPRKDSYQLIAFWASWKHGSNVVNYNTRQALKAVPDSLRALTYSLDLEQDNTWKNETIEDTARWHTYCDYRGWSSPLVATFGIRNIPYMVLVDPKGTVRAMGNDYNRDIKPEIEKISKTITN